MIGYAGAMAVEAAATQPWRERKRHRTRAAVIDAALALFIDEGFDQVTVERIAERAQIAPRTFFRYFASKEDVVFADDDALHALLVEALGRQPPDVAPLVAALAASQAVAGELEPRRSDLVHRERLLEHTPSLRARDLAKRARWQDDMAVLLEAGRPRRRKRPSLDSRLVAAVAMACWQVAYGEWLRSRRSTLAKELERAYVALAAQELPGEPPASR